ncbi:hypothetical protein EF847_02240 [Actinobacteria bacterium YIM 96077]|uniref:Serpin domain-containing protein n=1 Tax=Phytoactinopolyspora halophila TaxID=1981511 RepID=A0A329R0Y3_9ACTN|nr:serpin family protein [Phytoactinopolyspora halophila]AYY11720.1 hypothetical protein EF847_02240 [Actinobacteria bacterium YIM 96077]RAW17846.1 hypothetical protein DPM12_03040 [Phytoactinopolyspora halophila]
MNVAEVNAMTAGWAGRVHGTTVLSGAGVWPLLAILAASADEPGRSELADAVGVPADDGMEAARQMLKALGDIDGIDAALGVWAQEAAQVYPEWAAQLPPANVGQLTGDPSVDKPELDRWARDNTGGLIEHCPVDVHPDLMLVLATALALRTTWVQKFSDDQLKPKHGAWAGRRLAGLNRTSRDLDELSVADTDAGPLSLARIEGDNGLDVHLVLAEEGQPPSDVLPAAIAVVGGEWPVRTGAQLLDAGDEPSAPGVRIVSAQRPSLSITTVRFSVRSEHDLTEHAELLGLQRVSRSREGHFSRIAPVALYLGQARQSAVATFSATGFEAAAVTAMGLSLVSMPVYKARGLQLTIDRPFGFVAVHRATGLVMFAGWVDDPEPWQDE